MSPSPRDSLEPTKTGGRLFCFGYGYTASFLAEKLLPHGWTVAGTTTDKDKRDFLRQSGVDAYLFDTRRGLPDPHQAFAGVTHVLLSIPPGAEGDPAFQIHGPDLCEIPTLEWAGYLSSTGVYGNRNGEWVDEASMPAPDSRRGSVRLKAEQQWQSLRLNDGFPLHTFRIAGIYGPGRSVIEAVRAGTAQRIEKPGHVFNRIHVEDIVQALIASINRPSPGAIYNLADDHPAGSAEVITFACNLLGIAPPPVISYDQAELAPIVRSFYKDNKRVKNDRLKTDLGVSLLYPDYRSGLQACLATEAEDPASGR